MFIVYHKETTRSLFWQSYGGVKLFKSQGAAKAAITREAKKRLAAIEKYQASELRYINKPQPAINVDDYAIADAEHFAECIEKSEPVRSLMNGAVVMERVNTPYFLSVGSNTYWEA